MCVAYPVLHLAANSYIDRSRQTRYRGLVVIGHCGCECADPFAERSGDRRRGAGYASAARQRSLSIEQQIGTDDGVELAHVKEDAGPEDLSADIVAGKRI